VGERRAIRHTNHSKTTIGSTGEGNSHTVAGSEEMAGLLANPPSSDATDGASVKTAGEVKNTFDNGSSASRIGGGNAWSPSCE